MKRDFPADFDNLSEDEKDKVGADPGDSIKRLRIEEQ
jgi:hypothetical protein